MKKIIIITTLTLSILIVLSALLIYWHEADKGTRILCSIFREGAPVEQVTKTLNTANLLTYNITQIQNNLTVLETDSRFNLHTSECSVLFDENSRVVIAEYTQHFNLNLYLAGAGSLTLLVLAGFQFLLSIGLPFGRYAWGGNHDILPKHLRIGSLTSSIFLIFASLLLIYQSEWIQFLPPDFPFSELNIFFGVIFLLGTLITANSGSGKERNLMTPAAGVVYVAFLSAVFVL